MPLSVKQTDLGRLKVCCYTPRAHHGQSTLILSSSVSDIIVYVIRECLRLLR